MTPVMDASWGHSSQYQLASSGRQDAVCDLYPDAEFQALISNTICTPPRPLRSFDLLASPTSPGWLHNWSSHAMLSPFSPKQNPQELLNMALGQQSQKRPAAIQRSYSANLPVQASHSHPSHHSFGSPELCHSDLFVHSLDSGSAVHMQQHSDSSLTCHTPAQQQQRQTSGCLSVYPDSGLQLTHNGCAPVAASAAVSAAHSFPSQSNRGPALRRSSNRVPAKRTLEPDFEVTQVVHRGNKTRNTRRGPTGPCKVMRPSTSSGHVKLEADSGASSICGLLSPFTLLKPFGESGSSLEELNKKIRESARKAQPASSSDDSSNAGSKHSCSAGSVTMNVLPKGVPVGSPPPPC